MIDLPWRGLSTQNAELGTQNAELGTENAALGCALLGGSGSQDLCNYLFPWKSGVVRHFQYRRGAMRKERKSAIRYVSLLLTTNTNVYH